MSRIRSIHPGLFTDEAFVSISPIARIFFIGLWTECDDNGSFEWSPLKLKMRILPADNADASELLAEIERERGIMRYEVNGKAYGAVRNFCQYQRPKKPNSVHPQTDEVRNWVNTDARSTRDGSEPVTHQLPTPSEKPRQMEDGGCRMEDGVKETPNGVVDETSTDDPALKPQDVIDAWNELADRKGLRKAIKLTDQRRKQIHARIRQNTLDEWREALAAVERSRFCCGENDRGWRADLDFLLQPKSFTRLIEGFYDGAR